MVVGSVVCAGCVLALLVAEFYRYQPGRAVAKTAASTSFLVTALAVGALDSLYGTAVLVALLLSWWGDVFLLWKRKSVFLAGLVSFLLGHVAFCVAFALRGLDPFAVAAAVVGLLVPAAVVGRWLLPQVSGGMKKPVMAYMTVISVMVALAVGTVAAQGNPWIALAAVSFYLSDLAVARDRFVESGFVNRLWGLPLYYGAQILFVCTLVA